MRDASTAPSGLGVLEKAMGLLNLVSARRGPMTFTELLHASGLPKATLHRTLATLVREGLLRHERSSKTFQLGFRLLELAHEVWSDFDLRVAAQDELVRLRDAVSECVQLCVPSGSHVVVVASEDAARGPPGVSRVGERYGLTSHAAGLAIAASLDSAGQRALFDGLGPGATTRLRATLDLVRARGYAIDDGMAGAGTASIAAPVFDIEQRPVAALAVCAPADQLDPRRAHSLSSQLIAAARAITHNAGGKAMSIGTRHAPDDAQPAAVNPVGDARALLGEGPTWSTRDQLLYWVDILAPAVHAFDPSDGSTRQTPLGAMASMIVPRIGGGLLVATPGGLMTLQGEDGTLEPFAHPSAGRTGQRYNDGKCDRLGRLWIGSMDLGVAPNRGALYRVNADRSWKQVDDGFTVPNGLGFSPDNRQMYFTDTDRRTVYAYDFELTRGVPARRRPLIVFDSDDGKPDGLCVDAEGCLWVAVWDAWRISRFAPDGEELMRIRLPVPRPTSCCFGGPNLRTLYVTSASVRLSGAELAAAPLSGALLALEVPGVRGLPETPFAG